MEKIYASARTGAGKPDISLLMMIKARPYTGLFMRIHMMKPRQSVW